ncbi:MAG: poly-gamma-glutamate system protein [Candidatus Omnitrophota bacterium]
MMIPQRLDKVMVVILSVISVVIMAVAHDLSRENVWYEYKKNAAETMLKAEIALIEQKIKPGVYIKRESPGEWRPYSLDYVKKKIQDILIHKKKTPLRTTKGVIGAKRAATDHDLAAIVVELLKEAGVRKGDTVAVAFTGSLPGANIAVLSAAKAMELNPVIISSLGASRGGATSPEFSWLDIERILYENGMLPFRSAAASMGGRNDVQASKSEKDRQLLRDIIARNNVPLIYDDDKDKNVAQRMEIYKTGAGGRPIKAFINVGGDAAVLGKYRYRRKIPSGVVFNLPLEQFKTKGVILRMAEEGTPIVNVRGIKQLFAKYDPSLGAEGSLRLSEGAVLFDKKNNVLVSACALCILIALFILAIRFDAYILPHIRERRDPG